MVFSSIQFVYIFLPVFLLIYYRAKEKYRNGILLIGSLVFYSVGSYQNPEHIAIFIICLVMNYLVGKNIAHSKYRKVWLFVGISYDIGILFYFKYAGFLIKECSGMDWNIVLPIGISFYSFQAMSYLWDVYRDTCKAEQSWVRFGAYISMFPQLIAGPIVTYPAVSKAMRKRACNMTTFLQGARLFVFGLGLKVILANQIGGLFRQAQMIGYESISIPLAWMAIYAYSFQLYFDFYGYSLMAIGLGKMLGFHLPENFKNPYMSTSMTEFWRRWHITLGAWFREYVYIPLGGNRKGKLRTVINLFLVWMLTGIWHGAGYNFVLWGFVLFVLIMMEKSGIKKILDKHQIIGHMYMILVIPLTWAIFVNTDLQQLGMMFQKLFGLIPKESVLFGRDYIKYLHQYGWLLAAGLLFSTPIPRNLIRKIRGSKLEYVILMVIFCTSAYCMARGMDDPFLYFQF